MGGIDYCNETERLKLIGLFKHDVDVKPLYRYLCPIIIFVCFFSIIFNAILMSISRQGRFVNKSPILLLSLNLAITDLIASLLNGLGILFNSYLPEVFNFKMDQCLMLTFEVVRCAALIASALHLLALAFIHYRGIVNPLHYRSTIFFSQRLSRTINIISIFCWIIPLTIMLVWFSSTPCQGFQTAECDFLFLLGFTFRYMVLTMFFLPLLLMSILYLRIFIIISRHQKGRRLEHERSTLMRGVISVAGPIGSTAAALNLPQLMSSRANSVPEQVNEDGDDNEGNTRCPLCTMRAAQRERRRRNSSEGTTQSQSASGEHDAQSMLSNAEELRSFSGEEQERDVEGQADQDKPQDRQAAPAATVIYDDDDDDDDDDDVRAPAGGRGDKSGECVTSNQLLLAASSDKMGRFSNELASQNELMGARGLSKGLGAEEKTTASDKAVVFVCNDDDDDDDDDDQNRRRRRTFVKLKASPLSLADHASVATEAREEEEEELSLEVRKNNNTDEDNNNKTRKSCDPFSRGGGRCKLDDELDEENSRCLTTSSSGGTCVNGRANGMKKELDEKKKQEKKKKKPNCGPHSGNNEYLLLIKCTCDNKLKQSETASSSSKLSRANTVGANVNITIAKATSIATRRRPVLYTATSTTTTTSNVSSSGGVALEAATGSSISANFATSSLKLQRATRGAGGHQVLCSRDDDDDEADEAENDDDDEQLARPTKTNSNSLTMASSRDSSGSSDQARRTTNNNKKKKKKNAPTTINNGAGTDEKRRTISSNGTTQAQTQTPPTAVTSSSSTRTNSASTRTHEPQRRHVHAGAVAQTNTKALVTTLLILGTYFVSYVPAIIFQVLTCIDHCPYPLYDIPYGYRILFGVMTTLLLIAKSIVDPLIYSYRMNEIQLALNRYLSKRRSRSSQVNNNNNTSHVGGKGVGSTLGCQTTASQRFTFGGGGGGANVTCNNTSTANNNNNNSFRILNHLVKGPSITSTRTLSATSSYKIVRNNQQQQQEPTATIELLNAKT